MISEPLVVEIYPFKVRWSIERLHRPTFTEWEKESAIWQEAKLLYEEKEFFYAHRVAEVFLGSMLLHKEKEVISIGRFVSDYSYDDNEEIKFEYDELTLEQSLLYVADLSYSRIVVSNAWISKVANLIILYQHLENYRTTSAEREFDAFREFDLNFKYPFHIIEAISKSADERAILDLKVRLAELGVEPSEQMVERLEFLKNKKQD